MIEKIPPDLSKYLICPMPGLITAIHVEAGDKVEAGQPLAIVEAMKMQLDLRAPRRGRVESIAITEGARVERRALASHACTILMQQ